MLAKKTAKNQVTLPKEIADRFPDTVYFDVRVEGRKITLRPVRIETEGEGQNLGRIRGKMLRGAARTDTTGVADRKDPPGSLERNRGRTGPRAGLPEISPYAGRGFRSAEDGASAVCGGRRCPGSRPGLVQGSCRRQVHPLRPCGPLSFSGH